MEGYKSGESIPKNKLLRLEGGDFFASAYPTQERASESWNAKATAKNQLLRNLYGHYQKEWLEKNAKTKELSDQDVRDMHAHISNIPPEELISLLKSWQEDWGEGNFDTLDEESKVAVSAADDLISEMSAW